MAYIIGKRPIADVSSKRESSFGLTLPITIGNNGYFSQSSNSTEQVRSNLVNLLQTEVGERIMQPKFGTGLRQLLFEPIGNDTNARIESTITESVAYWLPYVNIDVIDIDTSDDVTDMNSVRINIKFSIGSDITLHGVTFTIDE